MWHLKNFSKVDIIEHSSVIMVEITRMNENNNINEMLLRTLEIGIKISIA